MRLITSILLGGSMFGVGAMAQNGAFYDLGEALKPIEDIAVGGAKAGAAVAGAAANGIELPSWLLLCALVVLGLRFVLFSPIGDKVVQGRNDRDAHEREMALRKLNHEQELERLALQHKLRAGKGD